MSKKPKVTPTKIKPIFDPIHGGGVELELKIEVTPDGRLIVDGQHCRDIAHAQAILSRKVNELRLATAKRGIKVDFERELADALSREMNKLKLPRATAKKGSKARK